jgi:hypothetical protein
MTLVLEAEVELSCDYDREEDILYAWVGEGPRAAITYETDDGHLIRLDPDTHEFVGVTIFNYEARWADRPIKLEWELEVERPVPWIPRFARKERQRVTESRTLRSLSHDRVGTVTPG